VGGVVVGYRTRNREVAGSTHTRSTASNFEQVANLLCAQANSASYPQRDGKWVVATAIRREGLVWLIGAMVCLLAAPLVQLSISAGNGWPHNALRHHWLMPINCNSEIVKALLVTSLTRVSGAITNIQTFTFSFSGGITRNLAIANSSCVSCVHKVTTVSSSPKWPSKINQGNRKFHGSIERI